MLNFLVLSIIMFEIVILCSGRLLWLSFWILLCLRLWYYVRVGYCDYHKHRRKKGSIFSYICCFLQIAQGHLRWKIFVCISNLQYGKMYKHVFNELVTLLEFSTSLFLYKNKLINSVLLSWSCVCSSISLNEWYC